jgi:hypothetical protein
MSDQIFLCLHFVCIQTHTSLVRHINILHPISLCALSLSLSMCDVAVAGAAHTACFQHNGCSTSLCWPSDCAHLPCIGQYTH